MHVSCRPRYAFRLPTQEANVTVSQGISIRTYIPLTFWDDKLNAADIFLIVLLVVLITLLISFRLVKAQQRFKTILPNADHKVYLGIVGILIESAIPVALFGVPYTAANLTFRGVTGPESFRVYQVLTIFNILFHTTVVG